jgi:hypothetical protein
MVATGEVMAVYLEAMGDRKLLFVLVAEKGEVVIKVILEEGVRVVA